MKNNEYVRYQLEKQLSALFQVYDISQTKVDYNLQTEEGHPNGTDVYTITGLSKSDLYVHRLYIRNEDSGLEIEGQIEKLIERIGNEISKRNKLKIQEDL